MAIEIERKFLVKEIPWRESTHWVDITQGYLSMDPRHTVRIRLERSTRDRRDVEQGIITIKGQSKGITRVEYEYEIPVSDAANMISGMSDCMLTKRRWYVQHGGHEWHVDEFRGHNSGLVLAEIELGAEDERWERPSWLGEEVTHDDRYINANLAINPYGFW